MQKVLIVSHTHWDREWYLTFEEYRARLVVTFDKTLDLLDENPAFHSFAFDGQTLVVDDYLEIRPEARERLARAVAARRLRIGPQYIIPAAYSLRGEGWVRNFALGMDRCDELGESPGLVYMPEPTALPEQWPQIIRRFGFDTALWGRGGRIDTPGGHGEPITDGEFYWEGAEGSRVLISFMPLFYEDEHGDRCLLHYCNASDVLWCHEYDPLRELPQTVTEDNLADALHRLGILRRELSRIATSDTVLLMHGCDHLPPQPNTPQLIEALKPHVPDAELVHGCFDDYMNDVKAAGNVTHVRRGESAGRGDAHSRVHIRRMDADTQIAMIRRMEPAAVLAHAWRGAPEAGTYRNEVPDLNTRGLREQAWKYLLQNHAHDTIWGAAVDAVYPEVESRYQKSQQIASELAGESLFHVTEAIATDRLPESPQGQYLVAVNTLGWSTGGAVETQFQLPPDANPEHLAIRDAEGRIWPAQVIESHVAPWRSDRYRRTAYVEPRRKVRAVVAVPDLPATSYTALVVEPAVEPAVSPLRCGDTWLENDRVRVDVHRDGSFDLTDRATGRKVSGLNQLVDDGDCGHGWTYGRLERPTDVPASRFSGSVKLTEQGPARGAIDVSFSMKLPVGLTRDGQGRRKTTRSCPVTVRIALGAFDRRVEVRTEIDNRVDNHRLRAHFPTGIHADVMQCNGAYGVHEREIRLTDLTYTPKGKGIGFAPLPPTEQGMFESWLDLSDGQRGVALMTRGVPQHEVLDAADGSRIVALTLMRAVVGHGFIHDPDLTHGHQCHGPRSAEYAVCLHEGNWLAGGVHVEAARYESPAMFSPTTRHSGVRDVSGAWLSELPPEVELAGMKPADDGDGAIVRLVNLTRADYETGIRFSVSPDSVERCDLRERFEKIVPVAGDGSVAVTFAPMEVVTLRVRQKAGYET